MRKDEKIKALIRRDGDRCFYCGRSFEDPEYKDIFKPQRVTNYWNIRTIDHYIPRVKGGTHAVSNLRLACGRCNSFKGESGDSAIKVHPKSEQKVRTVYPIPEKERMKLESLANLYSPPDRIR